MIDVLIFSAGYGGGHQAAAQALKRGFNTVAPHLQVQVLDYITTVNPWLGWLVSTSYRRMLSHAPIIWNGLYRTTDKLPRGNQLDLGYKLLSSNTLKNLVDALQPRLVICTHFIPAQIMASFKRRNGRSFSLATVITDQTAHSYWLNPATELYIVGSDEVAHRINKKKTLNAAVAATGIPIDPVFEKLPDKSQARRILGLKEDLPVLLVMGGADGMVKNVVQVCRMLGSFPRPVQIEVVAGRNALTKQKAAETLKNGRWPARVHGFVNNIPLLMAAGDLLIGKAGGLTTAEAMAGNLPVLIYKPIPGQEEENTKLLVAAGAARKADNLDDLKHQLLHLLSTPQAYRELIERTDTVGYPCAARDAVGRLISLMEETYPSYSKHVTA